MRFRDAPRDKRNVPGRGPWERTQILHKIISTHLLIMEVDFCPALCIAEMPILRAF